MFLLVLGLVVFIGIHLVPTTGSKAALVNRLGAKGYKGIFSLLSLLGLVLIVIGFGQSEVIPLWEPQPMGRSFALSAMPLVFIFLAASHTKTNITRFVKHPMLTAVLIWALLHLGANGDLRALVLFGSLGLYSLVDMFITKQTPSAYEPQPILKDVAVVVGGLVASGVFAFLHTYFAGVALF